MAPRRKNQVDVDLNGRADLTQLLKELDKLRKKVGEVEGDVRKAKGEITGLERAGGFLKGLGQQGAGTLGSMVAGGLTGGAMAMRTKAGLDSYTQRVIQMDAEARSVKSLTMAYRDYHNAIIEVGRAHGYSNNDVQALASMDARLTGRAGSGQRLDNLRLQQGFGRAYGMSATESGSYFNDAGRRGITTGGGDVSPRQFASMIADATVTGGMQGRESEVISSITDLAAVMNSKTTGIQGTANAAGWLSTLNATGIRGLQGEGGSQLLGKVNNAIQNPNGEAGNLFLYRALSDNKGGMPLADFEYLKEEGLAGVANKRDGKTNFQRIMEASHNEGKQYGGRYGLMIQREALGVTMHEAEALNKGFMGPDGKFNSNKMGALESRFSSKDFEQVDASTWGLLGELANAKPGDSGTLDSVRREFEELSGTKTTGKTTDELFNEIKAYGKGNVLLSEGQDREKVENDRDKAYEAAGAKLYDLEKAATKLETKFVEMTGSLPGVLGGIAPSLLGGLASGGLMQAGSWGVGALLGPLKGALGFGGSSLLGNGAIAGASTAATSAAGAAGAGAAGTGAAAAGTGAVGAGAAGATGTGLLAGGAMIAGGLAAAAGGSEFSARVLGTERYLGKHHRSVMGKGIDNILGGEVGPGDIFKALSNSVGMLGNGIPAVLGGFMGGGINAATGRGSFKEGYYNTFDDMMLFDTEGERQRNVQRSQYGTNFLSTGNSEKTKAKSFTDTLFEILKNEGDHVGEEFAANFQRGMNNVNGPGGTGWASSFMGGIQKMIQGMNGGGGGGFGGGGGGGGSKRIDSKGFGGKGFDAAVNSMIDGGKVISGWGDDRSSTMGKLGKKHEGIDIAADEGTDIRALAGGTVEYSQWNEFGGNAVQIRDEKGRKHYYAHLQNKAQYKVGDTVKAGEVIGQVGRTGQGKEGAMLPKGIPAHLHYQVSDINGNWVDPKEGLADECPACITNQKIDATKVNALLKGTGMEGMGAALVESAIKHGVPVELMLSMARKETSFGKKGTIGGDSFNPFNLEATGKWGDTGKARGGRFAAFDSMESGIEGFAQMLGTNYRKELDSGDLKGLVNRYAPPSENNSDLYTKQLQDWSAEYANQIKSSAGGEWKVNRNRMQMVHRDETILPANIAGPLRRMIERPSFSMQQAQQGAMQIQVSFEPLVLQYPDGSTYTAQMRGQARQPFQGILNYPMGGIA